MAIRALAASMMGRTASARVYTEDAADYCGLPGKIERCLRVRYGGGVAMELGLAGKNSCVRHGTGIQTIMILLSFETFIVSSQEQS